MKPTVLVIDDEKTFRIVAEEALSAEGFTVTSASNGQAGLAAWQREPSDLVILDRHLPDTDGIAILEAMTRESREKNIDSLITFGSPVDTTAPLPIPVSPERVAALALITPAFDPSAEDQGRELARWDALERGLRDDGVEGFVRAYDLRSVPERWRDTVATVLRQRLSEHEHLDAVADALHAVPRSRPFESLEELTAITVPALVVASRDDADPGHPLEVGEHYARAISGARLVVEDAGSPATSPIAWQGGALSRLLAELASDAGMR